MEKDGWRVVVGGCLRRFLEVVEWLLEVIEGKLEKNDSEHPSIF